MESNTSDSQQQQLPIHATQDQLEAMQELSESLSCPLCHDVCTKPVSLGCGHFFCHVCIDKYCQNNWGCPGKTLLQPIMEPRAWQTTGRCSGRHLSSSTLMASCYCYIVSNHIAICKFILTRIHCYCSDCGMSVSMSRKDGRHYFQTNPELVSLIDSLAAIQMALQKAPANWWNYQVPLPEGLAEKLQKERGNSYDDETDSDNDDGAMFQTAQY